MTPGSALWRPSQTLPLGSFLTLARRRYHLAALEPQPPTDEMDIMKGILAFTAVAAMLTASSPSFAEDLRNVTVINGTGYGIKFLGFNNPGDNDWSDNELP